AEPGVIAETRTLDAIHITKSDTDDLVTIVEVVSPSNKTEADSVAQYQDRRSRLVVNQGVNVVEIDLTRSVKRLFNHPLTTAYPYHVSVYLPGRWPYVIGTHINEPLKRIALPLRGEVVPIEIQTAYNYAYQQVSVGAHILRDKKYNLKNLPFPSLLTADERKNAMQAVEAWKAELERLRDHSEK
ncbi:MAG: DUF4058 family protein, partial [Chitinophagaceae bacterium]|nr:DUF4058 family protein [Anaerolineae bacterium]